MCKPPLSRGVDPVAVRGIRIYLKPPMNSKSLLGVALMAVLAATGCKSNPPSSSVNAARRALEQQHAAWEADAFVRAATEGNTALVELYLKAGMDPNATNKYGYTGLMWAAGQGRDEVVKLLVERGADVHVAGRDGSQALMFAAGQGKISTAQI